jgi:hypothetical protein
LPDGVIQARGGWRVSDLDPDDGIGYIIVENNIAATAVNADTRYVQNSVVEDRICATAVHALNASAGVMTINDSA